MNRLLQIIIILLVSSCSNFNPSEDPDKTEIAQLKQKINNLEGQVAKHEKTIGLQDDFLEKKVKLINGIAARLNDIDVIQKNISYNLEGRTSISETEDKNIYDQINDIDKYIEDTEKQIEDLSKLKSQIKDSNVNDELIDELESIITILEAQLTQQKAEIEELNLRIKSLEDVIKTQVVTIEKQEDKINKLIDEIEELDKKYCLLISKRQVNINVVADNEVYLSYPLRKIEILSEHSNSSYRIDPISDDSNILKITNPNLFWSETNNLLIKVKQARL